MTDWNPDKYLAFKNERTQPTIDWNAIGFRPEPKHV
jgi:trans-aconitate methyltransferase